METQTKDKIKNLILNKRVMTLAVSHHNVPWASPVYFIWKKEAFFFFSNELSRHIRYSESQTASATIFHDSDQMSKIFGLQMTGNVKKCEKSKLFLSVVSAYVSKFEFLKQAFGIKALLSQKFFEKKFNSFLYGFYPETIFISDNSKGKDKQVQLPINQLESSVN